MVMGIGYGLMVMGIGFGFYAIAGYHGPHVVGTCGLRLRFRVFRRCTDQDAGKVVVRSC